MNAVPNINYIQNISATTHSVPNPCQKSVTVTTTNLNTTPTTSSTTTTTCPTSTTNTAVTVDAKTGTNPQVHTIPRCSSAEITNISISKPSSRKSSKASVNSSTGISYC